MFMFEMKTAWKKSCIETPMACKKKNKNCPEKGLLFLPNINEAFRWIIPDKAKTI